MAQPNLPGFALVAALALFGLGALVGVVIAQTAASAAGASISSVAGETLNQTASPVAGTPVSERRVLDTVLDGSTASDVVDTALTGSTTEAGPVNVFVEVNTFVGLGTLSTGEHGIHVQEPAACETGEDEP